jgi:glycerol kinase
VLSARHGEGHVRHGHERVAQHRRQTPRVSEKGAVTALAWVWQGQPTYAFEGLINFSAATIEWLKNQFGLIQSADEVEKLARSVKDNGGVYLVPAFAD